jgi:MSHA biogenesis protein MshJ
MKLPPSLEKMFARFDAMSLRERMLTAGAILAAVVMTWTIAILDPISGKHSAMLAEQATLEEQIALAQSGVAEAAATDPVTLALREEKSLKASLDELNGKLASESAGLIPPERMVQVIQDVLNRQRGVKLVRLHNKAVTSLVQSIEVEPASTAGSTTSEDGTEEMPPEPAIAGEPGQQEMTGPFVHPVEIVVEGTYLDVLAYLQTLEKLDWRFYWKVLELETQQYPINRVRIELSTLSMDKDWIGV